MNIKKLFYGLDLNKNLIQNARTTTVPEDNSDLVNKEYVDNQINAIPSANSLKEATHSVFYLNYSNDNPIRFFNADFLFVNCVYTILVGVETTYNSRPATSVPEANLYLNDDSIIAGEDVTNLFTNILVLKSNQRIFKFYVDTVSLDLSGNPILLNPASVLQVKETVNAVTGATLPPFNASALITSDLSNHLINNIKIGYLTLISNSQTTLIPTDEIIISDLTEVQLDELGINLGSIEISRYVKEIVDSSLNDYYILTKETGTIRCKLVDRNLTNISEDIIFEPSTLTLKGDGTPLSENIVTINGVNYTKLFIPFGYGNHPVYKNIMFYQIHV